MNFAIASGQNFPIRSDSIGSELPRRYRGVKPVPSGELINKIDVKVDREARRRVSRCPDKNKRRYFCRRGCQRRRRGERSMVSLNHVLILFERAAALLLPSDHRESSPLGSIDPCNFDELINKVDVKASHDDGCRALREGRRNRGRNTMYPIGLAPVQRIVIRFYDEAGCTRPRRPRTHGFEFESVEGCWNSAREGQREKG